MKPYVLSLLSASLVAAVVELLSPKGEGGRVASQVRMVAGLFLLVALLGPIREGIDLLRGLADGDLADRMESVIPSDGEVDYQGIFDDRLASIGAEEIRSWMLQTMESRFGVPSDGCSVWAACDCDGETLRVTEVRISLREPYALRDPHPIEDYFSEQLSCPCFVTVG